MITWDDATIMKLRFTASEIAAILCGEFSRGEIKGEEDFSSALTREMRRALNNMRLEPEYSHGYSPFDSAGPTFKVHATRTTNGFVQSEENLSGADILIGFSVPIAGEEVDKTALIQAKLFREEGAFSNFPRKTSEKRRLVRQCIRMRRISPEHSYVFVYSSIGIQFYPAADVIQAYPTGIDFLDGLTFDEFITRLFTCTVGDHQYQTVHREDFRDELLRLGIKHAFTVEVLPT
ncbi:MULTISPECIES: hypothetical protein [unclassified Rhizobium]|uniref:hypothetical protein n=2 Tax=unclassified Rhizobium TaxID=2613769 RepID=UPI000BC577C3|nr:MULTISPECIES: hypothetical protein [unclassified Rhizobium]MDH7806852.1 hypothetical protein [Rhizobium sp. AN67]MDQ4408133.1 hypothetical protein [Rhizobium sp. AN63]SOD57689.1 hypothetical protein SAMN05216595_3815 [Rhizobium sp. AN6A]